MINPLYMVERSFGRFGNAFVETDRDKNSLRSVVESIVTGQVENVLTVLEIIEDEGTVRNITEDTAIAVRNELDSRGDGVRGALRDWIDHWCGAGTADEINAQAGLFDEVYRQEREPA
jgi:hypothetical protein